MAYYAHLGVEILVSEPETSISITYKHWLKYLKISMNNFRYFKLKLYKIFHLKN